MITRRAGPDHWLGKSEDDAGFVELAADVGLDEPGLSVKWITAGADIPTDRIVVNIERGDERFAGQAFPRTYYLRYEAEDAFRTRLSDEFVLQGPLTRISFEGSPITLTETPIVTPVVTPEPCPPDWLEGFVVEFPEGCPPDWDR